MADLFELKDCPNEEKPVSIDFPSSNNEECAEQNQLSDDTKDIPVNSALTHSISNQELNLGEHSSMSYLLKLIPKKAQKGFNTFDVALTCIAALPEYIVLGSSVGIVYLYERQDYKMIRLRCEGYTGPVTCVEIVKSVDYMIAAGTKDGRIFCHQIPRKHHNYEKQTFVIRGIHKDSITVLEWSKNAEKLFSGDVDGKVVCTVLQYEELITPSSYLLVEENYPVVQLVYEFRKLLIGTSQRCLIFNPAVDSGAQQVGQQQRKCLGKFGICFFPILSKPYEYILYAARTNLRLWKCSSDGNVLETIMLKDAVKNNLSNISLLTSQHYLPKENVQLGLLKIYLQNYLITWNESTLLIIDPHEKNVIASCWELRNILNVSISQDEIFVLQEDRQLIRIANHPENIKIVSDTEDPLLKSLVTPFKQLGTSMNLKGLFTSDTDKPNDTHSEDHLFGWLKKSGSSSMLSDFTILDNSKQVELSSLKKTDTDNNFVEKCEIQKSEVNKEEEKSQTELPKITRKDFSHIKIDQLDEIVCSTKRKVKKKKNKGKKEHTKTQPDNVIKATPPQIISDICTTDSAFHFETNVKESNDNISEISSEMTDSFGTVDLFEESILEKSDLNNTVVENDLENTVIEKKAISTEIDKTVKVQSEPEFKKTDTSNNTVIEKNGTSTEIDKTVRVPHKPELRKMETIILEDILHRYSESKKETDAEESEKSLDSLAEDNSKTDKKISKFTLKKAPSLDIHSPEINVYSRSFNVEKTAENTKLETEINMKKSGLEIGKVRGNEKVKPEVAINYTDIWVQDKVPDAIIGLAACNHYLCCIDSYGILYYSMLSDCSLQWIKTTKEANQISVSPSGNFITVLHKGIVYIASLSSKAINLSSVYWRKVAKDVNYVAVNENCLWYISYNGRLHIQQDILGSQSLSKPVYIPCHVDLIQVACRNDIVCALTNAGTILFRTGITQYKLEGSGWKEIKIKRGMNIHNLIIGVYDTLWIIDDHNNVWFQPDIQRVFSEEDSKWWLIDTSELIFQESYSIQRIKEFASSILLPVTGNRLYYYGGKSYITSSEKGIWFWDIAGKILYSNRKEIIGHSWTAVKLKATASSLIWKYISIGSIQDDKDIIWGLLDNNELICFTDWNELPLSVQPLDIKHKICCLSSAYEALWVLMKAGDIFIRGGISYRHPEGTHWAKLDLSQLTNIHLVYISCGPDAVWACDQNGSSFFRAGSLKAPSGQPLHQAWIPLDFSDKYILDVQESSNYPKSYDSTTNVHVCKIYTGPNSSIIWAIDRKDNVYVREGVFPDLPVGTGWVYVKGIQAKELCVGSNHVWAVTPNSDIYCRFGITDTNYIGDYWKKIPGYAASVAVTVNGRLWAIGPDKSLFQHSTYTIERPQSTKKITIETEKLQEGDWELL